MTSDNVYSDWLTSIKGETDIAYYPGIPDIPLSRVITITEPPCDGNKYRSPKTPWSL